MAAARTARRSAWRWRGPARCRPSSGSGPCPPGRSARRCGAGPGPGCRCPCRRVDAHGTSSPAGATETRIRPPLGVNSMALASRLITTCWIVVIVAQGGRRLAGPPRSWTVSRFRSGLHAQAPRRPPPPARPRPAASRSSGGSPRPSGSGAGGPAPAGPCRSVSPSTTRRNAVAHLRVLGGAVQQRLHVALDRRQRASSARARRWRRTPGAGSPASPAR